MISTMERDFKVENGVASFPMKEYPNWYGIEDIGFIWHGEWADPEIEYKGKRINSTIVEDTMWERFREDCEEDGEIPTEDKFVLYMMVNQEDVYELIELAMEGE